MCHQLSWEKQLRNPVSTELSPVQDFSPSIQQALFFVVSVPYMSNVNMLFQKQLQYLKKKKKSAATSRLTYRVVPAPCKVRPHKQTTSGLSLHRPLNLEVWERGEKRAGIVVTPNSYQLEQDSHQSLRQLLMVFYRSLK